MSEEEGRGGGNEDISQKMKMREGGRERRKGRFKIISENQMSERRRELSILIIKKINLKKRKMGRKVIMFITTNNQFFNSVRKFSKWYTKNRRQLKTPANCPHH